MFLVPFSKYEDKESLDYVHMVIEIIQKCAQEKELQEQLLLSDCLAQLINVAKKAYDEEDLFPDETYGLRKKIIMTILQTFNDMNNSNEDEQGFVWHLQRPNNAKLLINKLKDDKSADAKIQQLA